MFDELNKINACARNLKLWLLISVRTLKYVGARLIVPKFCGGHFGRLGSEMNDKSTQFGLI